MHVMVEKALDQKGEQKPSQKPVNGPIDGTKLEKGVRQKMEKPHPQHQS